MLRAGDRLDSFTLIRELGRGGFGVVWLAEERTIFAAPRVALKIALEDRINLEAIKQEATLWVEASGHINVLPIFGVRVWGEHIVIISEYVPDGSLEEWLNRHGGKAPSVEAAADMACGILSGLEHLHSKGIIHRDLKPANILLQGETPRLTDFGLARLLKSNTHSMNAAGTLPYMAPEAFSGGRSVQTDVWAAGVIFYQLLAGSLPFPQQDIRALIRAIDAQEPEPPASVPAPLREVITRALQKEPARRYGSAAEMRKALRAAARAVTHAQTDAPRTPAEPEHGGARPTPRPSPDDGRAHDPQQLADTLPLSSPPTPVPRPVVPAAGRRAPRPKSKRLWLAAGVLGLLLVVILAAAGLRKFYARPQPAPPALTPARAKALDDARLHAEMGRMLKDRSEWAQAEVEYRKAVESDADNLDHRRELANALVQLNRREEALAEYSELERRARESLRAEPGQAASHFHLGTALSGQRKYAEGEAAFREAIRLGPGDATYRRELALNLINQQKFAEAEAESREAIRLDPAYFRGHLLLGATLVSREKYAEAEPVLREAVRLNPKYAYTRRYLGDALLGQGKNAEAETEYREAAKLYPTWDSPHTGMGQALSNQKKYAEAEAEYREAVRLDPDDSAQHYNLGEFLFERKRYREAEAAFREAIRLHPDGDSAYSYLGDALYNQKKYAEAEAEYREAIRLQPNSASYHNDLGRALYQQRKYAEAEVAYRKATRLDPDEPIYHGNLGQALDLQKKRAEAQAEFKEAKRLEKK